MKATKDQVKVLKAYNNAQGQVNKTHNVAIAAMGKAVKAADYYEETIKKLRAEIAKLRGEQEKGCDRGSEDGRCYTRCKQYYKQEW